MNNTELIKKTKQKLWSYGYGVKDLRALGVYTEGGADLIVQGSRRVLVSDTPRSRHTGHINNVYISFDGEKFEYLYRDKDGSHRASSPIEVFGRPKGR
jgi:hypothetical protein